MAPHSNNGFSWLRLLRALAVPSGPDAGKAGIVPEAKRQFYQCLRPFCQTTKQGYSTWRLENHQFPADEENAESLIIPAGPVFT
jgi:hypothetical protein